jgi:hypothetical protein
MRVFISYRRSDSKDVAARIADRLAQVREIDHVFLDIDSIAHGEDFPERLDTEIREADVCLAVIGPGWQGALDDAGKPRIWSEGDFVRKEIATAIASDKRLIPCLVDDAQMPGEGDLPPDIAALAGKNACIVRHTTFRVDFEILCEAVLGKQRARDITPLALSFGVAMRAVVGLVIAGVLALGLALPLALSTGLPLETHLGGPLPVWLVLLGLAVACQWGTYRFWRRHI